MDNFENLFILLLVGIFCFAIVTLFRSNKALEKAGEVEKEVKTLEEKEKELEDEIEDKELSEIPESVLSSIESTDAQTGEKVPDSTTVQGGTLYAGSFPKSDDIHMN